MEEISQELALRMAACLRDAVKAADGDETVRNTLKEARAIVAMLPKPKPIDPDVLLMREIMHAIQQANPKTRPDGGNMSWLKGSYDHLTQAQSVVETLKRGRELAKARAGEGSV